ncbi:low molecular weight phosphatase family protein [Listeria booriae]|uniref:Low molecular weight phosphatase family protein n=1 Tax=Listeria booriae TaxID=1552123 RepID=A0A7X0XCT8_9LIST|nr:low molecular weight phosphatase family protein [Listeria booriae]MBC1491841.1 low molecular weight phosphatase family protein [Listeria booriae]MBC1503068.1 low molecular weight phosphatase family protein [Listeria booriae]MBC1524225.1 low molecular weight phosphatase family protein [Listeria booriae]MBC1531418.1 low molecular weight phosphatase family protein [Listeria booriae]MBC6134816.1 low molecular weight phosphatase family protein [Listeria booriae]
MKKRLIYFLSQKHIRSSMAEAWAKKLAVTDAQFISGSWCHTQTSPFVADALHEYAMEPPTTMPVTPSQQLLNEADLIVTIYDSASELAPGFPAELKDKIMYWDIKDPELSMDEPAKWARYQEVCDNIATSVKGLEKVLL